MSVDRLVFIPAVCFTIHCSHRTSSLMFTSSFGNDNYIKALCLCWRCCGRSDIRKAKKDDCFDNMQIYPADDVTTANDM